MQKTTPEETARLANEKWIDVRAFGQLFAFKSDAKDGVSIPIRGQYQYNPPLALSR